MESITGIDLPGVAGSEKSCLGLGRPAQRQNVLEDRRSGVG